LPIRPFYSVGTGSRDAHDTRGNERIATLGTMAGVVVMLYLGVVLA
jgi:hypothetical protein